LAVDSGISARELWRIYDFRDKFDRNRLEDLLNKDKTITWSKIVDKYLTKHKKETLERKKKLEENKKNYDLMTPSALKKACSSRENKIIDLKK
jgi:hypothetical protein